VAENFVIVALQTIWCITQREMMHIAYIKKSVEGLIGCLLLILRGRELWEQANWPQAGPSQDSIPISYEVYGSGEPTLVFVNGWS